MSCESQILPCSCQPSLDCSCVSADAVKHAHLLSHLYVLPPPFTAWSSLGSPCFPASHNACKQAKSNRQQSLLTSHLSIATNISTNPCQISRSTSPIAQISVPPPVGHRDDACFTTLSSSASANKILCETLNKSVRQPDRSLGTVRVLVQICTILRSCSPRVSVTHKKD